MAARSPLTAAVGIGTEVIVTFPAGRVLDGPRGEVLAGPNVASESQRKLIAITGLTRALTNSGGNSSWPRPPVTLSLSKLWFIAGLTG